MLLLLEALLPAAVGWGAGLWRGMFDFWDALKQKADHHLHCPSAASCAAGHTALSAMPGLLNVYSLLIWFL